MIRTVLATAAVGGALLAGAALLPCSTQNAVAGSSEEASTHCTRAQEEAGTNCDRAAHATTAEAAPQDGQDAPCPYHAAATSQAVLASTTRTLHVADASCGSCIVPIREQLSQLAGVTDIVGGQDFKDILVTLKEGSAVTDAQLIAAVKAAGYAAVVKEQAAPEQS